MREDYRREMACQIVHDSWHRRGFSSLFAMHADGAPLGYAAVGGPPGEPHDVLKEFYLVPEHRALAQVFARRVIEISGARFIEAQTNDVQLSLLLWDCAEECTSEILLFADGSDGGLEAPGVTLRVLGAMERETVFVHQLEPVGHWGLADQQTIVATGGFLTHYNPPFVDLFLEVAEPFRGRGYGSYLVQELRRLARSAGHAPGARCHENNQASRVALQRGGMRVCGRVVRGRVRSNDAW
jgi:GNAT superfamily N-acetyltransferase